MALQAIQAERDAVEAERDVIPDGAQEELADALKVKMDTLFNMMTDAEGSDFWPWPSAAAKAAAAAAAPAAGGRRSKRKSKKTRKVRKSRKAKRSTRRR
jgi:hypothetical protein